ncbi:MAG TPA: alpha/beta hydrolase [Labilithrix sp.]|jgi:pimeloyl-ACP methyl ester carboxylesterase|nr:alpha/beta hydrolase [Labilithrix sp.]
MLNERIAKNVGPDKIDIAWEERGDRTDPTVLLVMGVAAQLVHWPEGFLDALLARGLHCVRFDNRDAGHSTHLANAPLPDMAAALKGDLSSASYTLSNMAADAVGLLDALGIESAHVVGASMGGDIAQTIAIEHPSRVRSLTSMMATTGAPSVGQPDPETLKALFGGPPTRTRDDAVARVVRVSQLVGSPGFPSDPAAIAETAGIAYDRDHDELAAARQGIATIASGDRTERLRTVAVPTLVLHGLADKMRDASGGRATAAAIPGAELVLIDGLGHNLPAGLWETIADYILDTVRKGEAHRARSV